MQCIELMLGKGQKRVCRGRWEFASSLQTFYFYLFVCLFLAVLGLHCYVDFYLVAASRGYLLVCGLLTALTSLVEHGLEGARASVIVAPRL